MGIPRPRILVMRPVRHRLARQPAQGVDEHSDFPSAGATNHNIDLVQPVSCPPPVTDMVKTLFNVLTIIF